MLLVLHRGNITIRYSSRFKKTILSCWWWEFVKCYDCQKGCLCLRASNKVTKTFRALQNNSSVGRQKMSSQKTLQSAVHSTLPSSEEQASALVRCDLVLFIGRRCNNKTLYYYQNFVKSHERISLEEWKTDQNVSLHAIFKRIIRLLEKVS